MSEKTEFYEVVAGRRSVRKFKPDPVSEADLREIVRVATQAPSASNKQMWRFVAVADPERKVRLREAVEAAIEELAAAVPGVRGVAAMKGWSLFFADAPVVMLVFGEEYHSRTDDALKARGIAVAEIDRLRARPDIQSVGAAIQTMMLAARAKGYGTCWMCAPVLAAREIERLAGVGESWHLLAVVPLGVPAEQPKGPGRKPVEEVFTYLG